MAIFLLATLDTKGKELDYLRQRLSELHGETRVIDVGCLATPAISADLPREAVFQAAGTTLAAVQQQQDRGQAVSLAAAGASALLQQAFASGEVEGVLGIGGSAGTTIATTAMQALPLGIPKVMLSTLASGNVRGFVGDKDIVMINSITDISGLNRISRMVLDQAAHAIAGLVQFRRPLVSDQDRPLLAATMFGVTTPCVEQARRVLESAGYEVLVFHATGTGGQAMEALIREGLIAGVLDLTTTELADELVGGVLSAGPARLTAAAETGVPQVVSVGATDMVNFWAWETVPERFQARNLYRHNANVTLMRTTADESGAIGRELARRLNQAHGPVRVMLPRQGVSAIDRDGQPFHDPAARQALAEAVRQNCRHQVIEVDAHINDQRFAELAAHTLLEMLG